MRRMTHHVLTCCLLLAAGIGVGFLLLYLVFGLPTQGMKEHVTSSLPMLEGEFGSDRQIEGYEATLRGGFTDNLMILTAIYDGGSHTRLERSLLAYRYESGQGEGWAPGYSLVNYLGGDDGGRELTYSRYWHGYLIFLKPLLAGMTPASLRLWSALVQYLLLGVLLWICEKKKVFSLGLVLGGALLFLYLPFLYASLSLSICFYITLAAVCLQLAGHDRMEEKGFYLEFFLLIGMATAYFDLLTYPLVCLGIPLTVYVCLQKSRGIRHLAILSAGWATGYVGMWAGKWMLAQVFTHENVLRDALGAVRQRTHSGSDLVWWRDWIHVMEVNTEPYRNRPFLLLLLLAAVLLLILCFLRRPSFQGLLGAALPFAAIALLPVLWYGMTRNHSKEHWMFTSKIWTVSFFAGLCLCRKLFEKKEKESEGDNHEKL